MQDTEQVVCQLLIAAIGRNIDGDGNGLPFYAVKNDRFMGKIR